MVDHISAESHVEQGEEGCVSVFWAAGVFSAFWPLGTVILIIIMVIFKCYFSREKIAIS